VPEEIAVLGVDDDEAVCELANPPISAIDHGCETIGWEAAKALDRLMRGEAVPLTTVRVDPVRVVVRQSTNTLAIDDPIVVSALQFIQANFAQPITTQDVLDEVQVSRPTLELHFRRVLGHSVHRQITLVRIKHAKELLQATRLELGAISVRCGFSYPSKFSAVFRREVGLSPSAYRERHLIRRRL
jgi:LacI family transcriptional regulator